MNISDEAVEAAAKAIRDDDWPDYEDQIHHPIKDYMSNARAALEAAAPYMLAAEYDRGFDDGHLAGQESMETE